MCLCVYVKLKVKAEVQVQAGACSHSIQGGSNSILVGYGSLSLSLYSQQASQPVM